MVWYPPRPKAIDNATEEENWRRTFGSNSQKPTSSDMSPAPAVEAVTTPPNTQTATPSASVADTTKAVQLDLFLSRSYL